MLVYLHIPKCGGTTLRTVLEKNISSRRRYYINPSNIRAARKELALMSEQRKRQIELLYGHLCFGWHEYFPCDAVYFTMIRNPIERVVSHYNYVRYRVDHAHYLREIVEQENMTISEYVTSGICDEVNNGMVRLLAGVEDIVQEPYGNSKLQYGTNDPELLEQALKNIENYFAVVGIQDRYDESLLLLRDRLGLRRISYQRRNVGSRHYKKRLPTDDDINIIKRYNQLDIALFHHMQKRFIDDLAQVKLLSLRLAWFRLWNWTQNNQVASKQGQLRSWARAMLHKPGIII